MCLLFCRSHRGDVVPEVPNETKSKYLEDANDNKVALQDSVLNGPVAAEAQVVVASTKPVDVPPPPAAAADNNDPPVSLEPAQSTRVQVEAPPEEPVTAPTRRVAPVPSVKPTPPVNRPLKPPAEVAASRVLVSDFQSQQNIDSLRQAAAEAEENLQAQITIQGSHREQRIIKAWADVDSAESAIALAELRAFQQSESVRLARASNFHDKHKATAAGVASAIKKTALNRTAREEAAHRPAAAAREEQEAKRTAMEKAAVAGLSAGQRNLAAAQRRVAEAKIQAEAIEETEKELNKRRIEIFEKNLEIVEDKLREKNFKNMEKQAKAAAEFQADFVNMRNKGINPYEVLRRKQVDEELSKALEQAVVTKQLRAEKLVKQLEHEQRQRKIDIAREDKALETLKKDSALKSGAAAKSVAAAFLVKNTKTHVPIIDPTGNRPNFQPSEFAVIPDRQAERTKLIHEPLYIPPQPVPREVFSYTPKISKYEREMIARGISRQRENFTSPQIAWGKVFKGPSFALEPAEIFFKDFVVGIKYTLQFKLTNISLTFNQFRLIPLHPEFQEFFEIDLQPPGRMSAGTSVNFKVSFTAASERSIAGNFSILAATGQIDFRLRAEPKKAELRFEPATLDFGEVTVADSKILRLRVTNDGALPAQWSLKPGNFSVKPNTVSGVFAEKSVTSIFFTFNPTEEIILSEIMDLEISGNSTREIACTGRAEPLPLYTEKNLLDVGVVAYGEVFREDIILRNKGFTALRADVATRTGDDIRLIPASAVIQAGGSFRFQVVFKFTEESAAAFPGDSGSFSVPIKFESPGQKIPVELRLVGKLTFAAISMLPKILDFGGVPAQIGSKSLDLEISNLSFLTQRYGFTRVPKGFKILADPTAEISGQFGSLKPLETKKLQVVFTPSAAVDFGAELTLKAVTGESLNATVDTVLLKGCGTSLIARVTKPSVQLAATCAVVSVFGGWLVDAKGSGSGKVDAPPESVSGLRISPDFFALTKGQSMWVAVEFCPREKYDEVPVDAAYSVHEVFDAERDCLVRKWRFPMSVRRGDLVQTIWLSVQSCLLPAAITVDPISIDFGTTIAGMRVVKKFTIKSLCEQSRPRLFLPPGVWSGFKLLSAVKFGTVTVEFNPVGGKEYSTSLRMSTDRGIAEVKLRGVGVVPKLGMEPEDGLVDFGAVLFREGSDSVSKTIKLHNESDVVMNYKVVMEEKRNYPHVTYNEGPLYIYAKPEQGSTAVRSNEDIELVFRPHKASPIFLQRFKVEVVGLDKQTYLYARGRSFSRQLYCIKYEPLTAFDTVPYFKHEAETMVVGSDLLIDLDHFPVKLLIGACQLPADVKSAPCSYEIVWDKTNSISSWLVITEGGELKGQVTAGADVILGFKKGEQPHDAKKTKPTESVVQGLVGLTGKLILSGGYCPSGEPATREIGLEIRATIN